MDNIVGTPVKGENFKYRDKVVNEILELLLTGNSVLLIGLRRIGKSSIMHAIKDRGPKNWIITYHDVQAKRKHSEFFSILLSSISKSSSIDQITSIWSQSKIIPNKLINFIKTRFSKLGALETEVELREQIIDYWEPLMSGIEAIIFKSKEPVIIILDEFPIFIERMLNNGISPKVVQDILGQLKRWRGEYSNFKLLIGGSISLDQVLSRYNIEASTINDFSRYSLEPLSKEEAKNFLIELANSCQLNWYTEILVNETLELLQDYYPFFLQAFFMQIRQRYEPKKNTLLDIFENKFIPSINKSFFEQFLNRLEKNYNASEQAISKKLFNFIVKKENYIINESEIKSFFTNLGSLDFEPNDLIHNLVSDDFLIINNRTKEFTFATNLVAHWWKLTRRL